MCIKIPELEKHYKDEQDLIKQAQESPETLFEEMEKSEDINYLTMAAHYVGFVGKEFRGKSLEVLEKLLIKYSSDIDYNHAIVREGTLYGLCTLHYHSYSKEEDKSNSELVLSWERISQLISFYTYEKNEKNGAVRSAAISSMCYLD